MNGYINLNMKDSQNISEFVQLLTKHQEVIRAYITTLLPNYQDVNDVLQDVNVKLWEKQSTFELGTNFGAWACTMARYSAMSYRSKLKRQSWLLFSDELVEKLAEPISDHVDAGYLQGKRTALHHCLKKLKPKDQELLKVRYHEDTSVAEHAENIGGSAKSLRVTLYRIRVALKTCVESREFREGGAV
jgi:RNA polymerase sigma-70 factor (ECF subfamily)